MKAVSALAALLALGIAGSQTAEAATPAASLDSSPLPADRVDVWAARPEESLALRVIYSNFKDDSHDRYALAGYLISSPESDFHQRYSVAAPFTPLENATLRKIRLPLFSMWVKHEVEVSLRKDEDGMPGAVMKRFSVPSPWWDGSGRLLIQTVTLEKGIPLIAGKKYWISTRALGVAQSAWFWNSLNLYGDFLRKLDSSKWEPLYDVLPAFAVLGD
ncbi:hypothetical protein [Ideonella sp. YS5]|uniref:hypothetical protein n=1 Tax=Ideonella sp. YS5 TaxID=3453714 RepID=UPI003EEE6932